MTRPTLSSYPTIELPTINGDSGVWGTVLNASLNQLDDLIKANETATATNTSSITTINADANTSGSIDNKVAAAVSSLRGTSTATLQSLESLIGDAGNVDLSSINSQITNLQTNLGAPTNATLSSSVYTRTQALETSVNNLVGSTSGDDTKSVRTIATEVIGSSNTGITSTAAQTLIDTSVAAIQGNTTQTIADLLTLITTLQGQVATLQQDVANLQSGKASASSVTALENTVNGTTGVAGLVTTVGTANTNATLAKATADQAALDVTSLTSSINSVSGRTTTLESAGYITSSALSPYITTATANSSYLTSSSLNSTLNNYATKTYVTSQGYLTASNLAGYNYATQSYVNSAVANSTSSSSFVSTSDVNWKRVRGLFEGQSDVNRTLPSHLYMSSSTSGYKNVITYYTASNSPVWMNQTLAGGNATYKAMYTESSSSVTLDDTTTKRLDVLINGTSSSYWGSAFLPGFLYFGESSNQYVNLHTRSFSTVPSSPSRAFGDPILFYSNYRNGTFQDNYSLIS